MLTGSRYLSDACHQDMRHRIYQTVTVLVAHTEYNFFISIVAALFDDHIKTQLSCRNQP